MAKIKLPISDERMLVLMAYAIDKGLAKNETEYLNLIVFPRNSIWNVKRGTQSFTRDQIYNACKLTGANANWVFGFETQMMRKEDKDPVKRLMQLALEIDALINKS